MCNSTWVENIRTEGFQLMCVTARSAAGRICICALCRPSLMNELHISCCGMICNAARAARCGSWPRHASQRTHLESHSTVTCRPRDAPVAPPAGRAGTPARAPRPPRGPASRWPAPPPPPAASLASPPRPAAPPLLRHLGGHVQQAVWVKACNGCSGSLCLTTVRTRKLRSQSMCDCGITYGGRLLPA